MPVATTLEITSSRHALKVRSVKQVTEVRTNGAGEGHASPAMALPLSSSNAFKLLSDICGKLSPMDGEHASAGATAATSRSQGKVDCNPSAYQSESVAASYASSITVCDETCTGSEYPGCIDVEAASGAGNVGGSSSSSVASVRQPRRPGRVQVVVRVRPTSASETVTKAPIVARVQRKCVEVRTPSIVSSFRGRSVKAPLQNSTLRFANPRPLPHLAGPGPRHTERQ